MCAEIARRQAGGIPLDDGDGPLKDPGEFSHRPELIGIAARFRVLTSKDLRTLQAAVVDALAALIDAKSAAVVASTTNALFDARRKFLAATLVAIEGLDGITMPLNDDGADALERTGLLTALYDAAVDFQEIPEGKVSRSG